MSNQQASHRTGSLGPTLDASGLRWEILSHMGLPGGAIAWLRITPTAEDLVSALLVKSFVIEETGVVAKLRVKNEAYAPLLLPTDLVVDGGKQARVIERSIIVPSRGDVEVPVRCVEAGRWAARDEKTAQKFSVNASATIQSRETLTTMKRQNLKTKNEYGLDQQEVWKHVTSELTKTGTLSETQSYTAFLNEGRHQRLERARAMNVVPAANANAVALVRPSGRVWVEAFPSREAMLPIVPSMVSDLLEREPGSSRSAVVVSIHKAKSPDVRAAEALREIVQSSLAPLAITAGTAGECFAIDGCDAAGQVLVLGGRLAHLVASVGI